MNSNEKYYFDNYPDTDIFYFTSDGYAFFNEHDANNHAGKLEDDEVRTIDREEADEE